MRGGYREGAGRKKGFAAKSAEEGRRIVAEMVAKELTPIVQGLIRKAKNGDTMAARELFDRAWGKPPLESETQQEQITGIVFTIVRTHEDKAALERGDEHWFNQESNIENQPTLALPESEKEVREKSEAD